MGAGIKECAVCHLKYVEKDSDDVSLHRSYHQQYLYINRKYAGEIINPRHKIENRREGYSLVRFGKECDKEKGMEMILRGEFTDFLFRTHRYISFKEFLNKELDINHFEKELQELMKKFIEQDG